MLKKSVNDLKRMAAIALADLKERQIQSVFAKNLESKMRVCVIADCILKQRSKAQN